MVRRRDWAGLHSERGGAAAEHRTTSTAPRCRLAGAGSHGRLRAAHFLPHPDPAALPPPPAPCGPGGKVEARPPLGGRVSWRRRELRRGRRAKRKPQARVTLGAQHFLRLCRARLWAAPSGSSCRPEARRLGVEKQERLPCSLGTVGSGGRFPWHEPMPRCCDLTWAPGNSSGTDLISLWSILQRSRPDPRLRRTPSIHSPTGLASSRRFGPAQIWSYPSEQFRSSEEWRNRAEDRAGSTALNAKEKFGQY